MRHRCAVGRRKGIVEDCKVGKLLRLKALHVFGETTRGETEREENNHISARMGGFISTLIRFVFAFLLSRFSISLDSV